MKYILILIILTTLSAHDADICISKYARYSIDINIKTNKGWLRVCNNNKLLLYANIEPTENDKKIICECFKKKLNIKDRNAEVRNND